MGHFFLTDLPRATFQGLQSYAGNCGGSVNQRVEGSENPLKGDFIETLLNPIRSFFV
jgi:hypothetical protein